jgi:uncharacterized membrane protein
MPVTSEENTPKRGAERRCIWSNQIDRGTREIAIEVDERYLPERYWVCSEHEAAFRAFRGRGHRDRYRFFGGLALVVVAALLTALLDWETGVGLVMIGLGLFMLAYPFATPQTIQMLGVRASLRLVRLLSMPVIGIGLYLLLRVLISGTFG